MVRQAIQHPWGAIRPGKYDYKFGPGRDVFRVNVEFMADGLHIRYQGESYTTPISELPDDGLFYETVEESELDLLRTDLKQQLGIPDELDWDYFLETAQRAKAAADKEGRNMTPDATTH